MADAAHRILELAEHALSRPFPLRVRAWDGSEAGPCGAPTLVFRRRRALRRLLWRPGELGLARAWVAGDLAVDGDLFDALDQLSGMVWDRPQEPPPAAGDRAGRAAAGKVAAGRAPAAVQRRATAGAWVLRRWAAALHDPATYRLAREALGLAGPGLPPVPPPEEVRGRTGVAHTRRRDKAAISHHYDVGNDFYTMVLGPSMVYSCAVWPEPDTTLEQAQFAKLDLVCRKLGLREDQRLLDVGCGWGSMVLHAAEHYGVRATGITLSAEQAAFARKRVAEAGLSARIDIRVQDYRDVTDGPYDAISSIGMAEHVGSRPYLEYARTLHGLLKPGGRLLNHQIARRPLPDEGAYRVDPFIDRYVFPDGELAPVGATIARLEEAGFEVRDMEALREHYARTLRAWVANLEGSWERAVRATSAGRARVWRLYMAASAVSFERNRIGVNQVLAVRADGRGGSGMPRTRTTWLS